eukprot:Polyplicarium_translucidae@DN2064_c0_g1_i1.p1
MADLYWSSEKRPVVIEPGAVLTKVGLGGQSYPVFFKARIFQSQPWKSGTDEWIAELEALLREVFFCILCVSPEKRPVVIVEQLYLARPVRNAIATILFEQLRVPAIYFVPSLVTSLFLTMPRGVSSGVVVDVGFTESRCMATCFSAPLYMTHCSTDRAGEAICKHLEAGLRASEHSSELGALSEDDLAEIRAKCCYVKHSLPDGRAVEAFEDAAVTLADQRRITVSAALRWGASEVLFDDSVASPTVVETLMECLRKTPVDARGIVVQNIVVCGGCAEAPGFDSRFAGEFAKALESSEFSSLAKRARFLRSPVTPCIRQWTGAAVAAHLVQQQRVSRAEHLQGRALPDWLSLPLWLMPEAEPVAGG